MNLKIETIYQDALEMLAPVFSETEDISLFNTRKVLAAFRECGLSAYHFAPSNGYGYNDPGREKLEEIWAKIFRAEAALVRPQFVSGTHALATVLLALLGPGDMLVSAVGAPYDTMQSVIGTTGDAYRNLKSRGVTYKEVPLSGKTYDLAAIRETVDEATTLVLIQRSRGYQDRASLFPEDIRVIIETVREKAPQAVIFVDNCYGEFTGKEEPIELGADICAGSLIKNAGGGMAPTGGYICGKAELVERCAQELTAPGLGGEMGSYAASYRPFFQGLFLAPHTTRQAVLAAELAGAVFSKLGFPVSPAPGHLRTDLITAITLGSEKNMCLFAEAIQQSSPVDAHVRPIPGPMPGYTDPIIMAAGTFVQGSTIEMSADGPIREPYTIYFQGSLTYEHAVVAILEAAEKILSTEG